MRSLFALTLTALLASGCVGPVGGGPPPTDVPATATPMITPTAQPSGPEARTVRGLADLVRSDAARAEADPQAARRASAALEALAADLYRELAQHPDDLVFSPYSVAVALAMARAGAKGQTAVEMDAVLHATVAGDLDAGFNALERSLARRPGTYPFGNIRVPLELATANQLWAQRGTDFGADFLDRLATHYGAGVRLVDYVRAREVARKTINEWVSEQTRARIPDLIKEGVLDELTRFVLTNAIYLKAKWTAPFPKQSTAPAPFRRLDGSETGVQMMRRGAHSAYAKGPGYEAVQLSYVGGLSMIVIVPDIGSFRAVEDGLRDRQRLGQVIGGLAPRYVSLGLPRFEFRSAATLNAPLGRLGMPTAFTDRADFSGISPRERLLLKAVVHEAFIAVDEEGTEAAAATAVIGGATGGPSDIVTLTVDRPFIFLIRDDETGAILFMGRVLDPN